MFLSDQVSELRDDLVDLDESLSKCVSEVGRATQSLGLAHQKAEKQQCQLQQLERELSSEQKLNAEMREQLCALGVLKANAIVDQRLREAVERLHKEKEALECQASQLLLDKANLQRDLEQAKKWHCGGCWNEENLQKQLEDARNGWKLDHADLVSERELNDDLKKQLLDATKQSDSHYSRAQRLEGELEQIGVKYSAQQCCYRILEQSGQEAAKQRDEAIARAEKAEKNYARCNDNWIETTRKLDQAEKELESWKHICRVVQGERNHTLDNLTACRKERDDWENQARNNEKNGQVWARSSQEHYNQCTELRTRVSELTSLLASKEQVIEGLKGWQETNEANEQLAAKRYWEIDGLNTEVERYKAYAVKLQDKLQKYEDAEELCGKLSQAVDAFNGLQAWAFRFGKEKK